MTVIDELAVADCIGRCWDPSATAGQYAAFAAILAGFSFTAMVTISGRPYRNARERQQLQAAITTLLVSFVNLLSVTVLYAVLAGERSAARAAGEEVFAALAASVAIGVVLYGLVQFIETQAYEYPAVVFRVFVGLALPFIGLIFFGLVAHEVNYMSPDSTWKSLAQTFSWTSPAAFLLLAAYFWWQRPRPKALLTTGRYLPFYSLGAIIVAGLLFSWVWTKPSGTLLSTAAVVLAQFVAFASAVLFTAALAATAPGFVKSA
jgi:hypothetical protein